MIKYQNLFTTNLGNSGCGFGSGLYPVYLEYSVNETSYLLKQLRYIILKLIKICNLIIH